MKLKKLKAVKDDVASDSVLQLLIPYDKHGLGAATIADHLHWGLDKTLDLLNKMEKEGTVKTMSYGNKVCYKCS